MNTFQNSHRAETYLSSGQPAWRELVKHLEHSEETLERNFLSVRLILLALVQRLPYTCPTKL